MLERIIQMSDRLYPNRYKGKCDSCKVVLNVDEGYSFKRTGWCFVCKSSVCMQKLNIQLEDQTKKLNLDGTIQMPYDANALILLRSMPGARWNPELKCWTVSTKVGDLPRVIELSQKLGLDIPESFITQAKEGTVESRKALERTKDLYEFQKEGVKFLSTHDKALIADEQGLGKTIQLLMSLPDEAAVIVVCPNSLKYNWQNETLKWRKDLKPFVCKSKDKFRMPNAGEIVIINYESLPDWLIVSAMLLGKGKKADSKYAEELAVVELNKVIVEDNFKDRVIHLIADECQQAKNFKSDRARKLNTLSRRCSVVWMATGTPLMNRPPDLYGILQAGNMNVFGGWSRYVNLFNGHHGQFGGFVFGEPSPEVAERARRIMIRRLKSEVLTQLPAKTFQTISFDADEKTKAFLDKFICKALVEKGLAKNLKEAAEKIDELIEILDMDDLPSFDQFSEIRAMLAKSRIPAMMEMIESYEESNTPLIVFSAHRAPIDELSKREGWAVITGDVSSKNRAEIVSQFQSGKLKGIGLTIAAGGTGLTLTRASTVLFVDLSWVPSDNLQAQDRAHRIGQTNNVLILTMTSNHPLDIHVQDLLEFKISIIKSAIDSEYKYVAAPDSVNKIEVVQETEDQMKERASKNNEVMRGKQKEIAKYKVARLCEVKALVAKSFTDEQKSKLIDSLSFLAGECDGAQTKDGKGFNKADTTIGNWLAMTGLTEDIEYTLLEDMLKKYKKQLGKFEC